MVPANTPMVTFENGQCSAPEFLLGACVFVRSHGAGAEEQVIVVHVGIDGPVEVARHLRARPGSPPRSVTNVLDRASPRVQARPGSKGHGTRLDALVDLRKVTQSRLDHIGDRGDP